MKYLIVVFIFISNVTSPYVAYGGLGPDIYVSLHLIIKKKCDDTIPGYYEKTKKGYDIWFKRYKVIIDNLDKEILENFKKDTLANSKLTDENIIKACQDLEKELFELAQSPLEKFKDPDSTWNYYIKSLKNANRKEAISCLSGVAYIKYKKLLNQVSDNQMKDMGKAVKSFKILESHGENAMEGLAVTEGNIGGFVYFQNINGNWKITEM